MNHAAFHEIKNGARLYALRPRYLDLIAEGLFALGPNDLVRALGRLIGIQRIRGDEASDLRAAMVYARWSRRVARAIRRAAA